MCKIGLYGARAYAAKIEPVKEVTSHVQWMESVPTIKLPNATPGFFFTIYYCCPTTTQSQDIFTALVFGREDWA